MTFASYQSFTDTMTLCGDFNTFSYTSNQQMQHPGDGAAGHVAIKCLDGEVFIVTDEDPRAKSFSGGPLLFKDSADGIRSDAYMESGNRMSSDGGPMLFNDSMGGLKKMAACRSLGSRAVGRVKLASPSPSCQHLSLSAARHTQLSSTQAVALNTMAMAHTTAATATTTTATAVTAATATDSGATETEAEAGQGGVLSPNTLSALTLNTHTVFYYLFDDDDDR